MIGSSQSVPSSDPITVVGIWSRGGNGHKAAWDAHCQAHADQRYVAYDILGPDMLNDENSLLCKVFRCFTGQNVGDYCVSKWDRALEGGNILDLMKIVVYQWIAELLFYWIVYFKMKDRLRDVIAANTAAGIDPINVPITVVSTQAMCTHAIVRAVLQIRKETSVDVKLVQYMTDMPTERSDHFYRSITGIGHHPEMRRIYKLFVASADNRREVDQEIVERHCRNIRAEYLSHNQFPIRQPFLDTEQITEQLNLDRMPLNIRLNNSHDIPEALIEADIIASGLNENTKADCQLDFNDSLARFSIQKEDKVALLLLGSKPCAKGVIGWIDAMQRNAKKILVDSQEDPDRQHYFFVYCGAPEAQIRDGQPTYVENRILREVHRYIEELQRDLLLPQNFNIVPFTFQDADAVALLEARADLTITRSGGSTCFELIHLAEASHQRQIPSRPNRISIIHSDGVPDKNEQRFHRAFNQLQKTMQNQDMDDTAMRASVIERILLATGLVPWETGNAEYLLDVFSRLNLKAFISNPEYSEKILSDEFFEVRDDMEL